MGFMLGGTADKLGNRYEGRWVVKQLLFLIAERVRSVELEAIGDDEHGVDLWVERLDGVREAHQCKAFNSSSNSWTIADLKQRKVLEKGCAQLARSGSVEFKFVSTIVAAELEDLSRNARESKSHPEIYFRHVVENQPREKPFKLFCRAVQIDPTTDSGRATAFDLLKRIECHPFPDDRATRVELEFLASILLEGGSPSSAIASLAEIATDNLHKTLTAHEVVRLLEPYSFRPISRGSAPRTAARLEELRQDFIDSVKPHLAAGQLIPRPETIAIRDILSTHERHDAIVLHGDPGFGKSGILYELANQLRDAGVALFAIRLDRQSPSTLSSQTYGQELGLSSSPVICLRDISAGQPAVLILDQLDALRWTNAHSSRGLAICKEMLREVQAARSLGAQIDVVIACRTFDLDRDPEIRAWLSNDISNLRIVKIEAESLPSSVVHQLVKGKGMIEPDSLKPAQLRLLESVHHLAIWLEIVQTEKFSPQFDSSTQLMRRFWNNRRQKLEESGCDPLRRDQMIGKLVRYMEDNACLSAPERLLANDEKLKTELQTWGVISILAGEASFGHQSNLDFLVADAAMTRMTEENLSVLDWLGPLDRQSLFRREQLRQVLLLLADERHKQFLKTVRLLLNASDVRFHLRQLTLEVLGQVPPMPETLDFVLSLLDEPQWTEHIRFQVIYGNKEYLAAIHERGLLHSTIALSDKVVWEQTADWVWSVRRQLPALVAAVCKHAIASSPDWLNRVVRMIGHDGVDIEPEELFSLRIKCLSHGSEPIYVGWSDFAKKHPRRAVRLYRALIKGWILRGANSNRYRDESHIYGRDSVPLVDVSKSFPRLTWNQLWPRLRWFIREQSRRKREWFRANERARHWPSRERLVVPATLRSALLAAAKRLVLRNSGWGLSLARNPIVTNSRNLTSLFVEALAHAQFKDANSAIEWLLDDLRRLHCGSGKNKPRWASAAKLIRRMSPHCSLDLFNRLQQSLLKFRDPLEKKSAEFWLNCTKHGVFNNQFGAAQYHLLPALCPLRRSSEATGRIGVLREKFAAVPREWFLARSGSRGGVLSSPIDSDRRYARMSDKSWLKLILRRELPARSGRWRYSCGGKGLIESSVEMMSRSFGRAARLDPERFARLGLKFPPGVHPNYISELLGALREINPPNDVPENQRADWCPATPASIDQLIEALPILDDARSAQDFCWLIAQRTGLHITDRVLRRLVQYSEHNDPGPDQLHVDCDQRATDCSTHTLEENSINSVRGTAALAIASILWQRFDLLPQLKPVIERLLTDEHPAVRVAATRFVGPVWKHDPKLAIEWLVTVTKGDSRIAASREIVRLYNHGFPEFADQLIPLIRDMLNSKSDGVIEAGAVQVAARWLFFSMFKEEFAQCVQGSAPRRKGVANTFCQLVTETEYTHQCVSVIEGFMNDEEKNIRHQLSRILNHEQLLDSAWAPDFLAKLIRSKAGQEEIDWLLWKLKDLPGSLEPFAEVLFVCSEVAAHEFASPSSNSSPRSTDIDSLVHLLLRLYESVSGPNKDSIRKSCLDEWDRLLQSRATVAWALTRGLDATR